MAPTILDYPRPSDLECVGAFRIEPIGQLCIGKGGEAWFAWLEGVAGEPAFPRPIAFDTDQALTEPGFRWELHPGLVIRRGASRFHVLRDNRPVGWLAAGVGAVVYLRLLRE